MDSTTGADIAIGRCVSLAPGSQIKSITVYTKEGQLPDSRISVRDGDVLYRFDNSSYIVRADAKDGMAEFFDENQQFKGRGVALFGRGDLPERCAQRLGRREPSAR